MVDFFYSNKTQHEVYIYTLAWKGRSRFSAYLGIVFRFGGLMNRLRMKLSITWFSRRYTIHSLFKYLVFPQISLLAFPLDSFYSQDFMTENGRTISQTEQKSELLHVQ